MNSHLLASWRRRLNARLARPQPLFLGVDGVQQQGGRAEPFADWCAAHRGEAVELIVSARLLHELVCEPGLPLDGEAALQAYAGQQFAHYFGAAAQRWAIAGWRVGPQCGASALHGLDWTALRQAADAAEVLLRQVRPVWAPLLGRLAAEEPEFMRASTAALAWVEGDLLSWLRLDGGRLQSLRQLRLAAPTPRALDELLAELHGEADTVLIGGYGLEAGPLPAGPGRRLLNRLDIAAPELAWFEAAQQKKTKETPGDAPLPRPDFLGLPTPRSALAWPLAATGALVLATAGWSALDSHGQLDQAQQRLARIDALQHRLPNRPPAAVVASRPADIERLRSAAEVQLLLQQNWEPLLVNVEQAGASPSAARLAWLGLDYNAARRELRLEGLTQDQLATLQLVDRLALAPGWRDVVLSRFQTGEQGLTGQRFELSAKLTPALLRTELKSAITAAPAASAATGNIQ
jgi:hypothetical protein